MALKAAVWLVCLFSLQGSSPALLGGPHPWQPSLPSSCSSCARVGRSGGGWWALSGGRRLFIYDVTILMYLLGGKTPQHHTIKLKTGGCGRSSSTADLEPSRLEKNNRNGCGSSPSARQVPCSSWLLLWTGPSLPRRAP